MKRSRRELSHDMVVHRGNFIGKKIKLELPLTFKHYFLTADLLIISVIMVIC